MCAIHEIVHSNTYCIHGISIHRFETCEILEVSSPAQIMAITVRQQVSDKFAQREAELD